MNASKRQGERLIPMRVSDGFKSFVLDQLDGLGEVTPRSMFGGVGLYRAGVFFGILAGDVLYLKVDDTNRPDYERAGAKPFRPYPNRPGTMQYYAVPLDILESAPELVAWARHAVAAALRAVSEPSRRRPRNRRPPDARAKR
jgi:DNA transformation protein